MPECVATYSEALYGVGPITGPVARQVARQYDAACEAIPTPITAGPPPTHPCDQVTGLFHERLHEPLDAAVVPAILLYNCIARGVVGTLGGGHIACPPETDPRRIACGIVEALLEGQCTA